MSLSIVIDASVAVHAVLPLSLHEKAITAIEAWVRQEVRLYAPSLWLSEVASVIRKIAVIENLSSENAHLALQAALNLPLEIISEDASTCRRAYQWAEQLEQRTVYDSLYLALAENLNAVFQTADRKFYAQCKTKGVEFVTLLE